MQAVTAFFQSLYVPDRLQSIHAQVGLSLSTPSVMLGPFSYHTPLILVSHTQDPATPQSPTCDHLDLGVTSRCQPSHMATLHASWCLPRAIVVSPVRVRELPAGWDGGKYS